MIWTRLALHSQSFWTVTLRHVKLDSGGTKSDVSEKLIFGPKRKTKQGRKPTLSPLMPHMM